MTQEEKDLLLKELSERLPYGVKVEIKGVKSDPLGCKLIGVLGKAEAIYVEAIPAEIEIEDVKPYLRSMSNMTKDEEDELDEIDKESSRIFFDDLFERKKKEGRENLKGFLPDYPTLDWLNSHHFDYRGLIKKGLALEAPKDMYEL